MSRKASIIIRTRNEERWIAACLRNVFGQEHAPDEVILVDNRSSDHTVARARNFDVKVVDVDEYLPGKALNAGVRASSGDMIVCLSGHCVPADRFWLGNLLRNLDDPGVAGVYGRQQPLSYSSDLDKRDLLTIFGLDRKVQRRDSFFHNANSAIPRARWEQAPFDETVTNIEDRVWAKRMLELGYTIVYEPEASVYHHHGIHQDGNIERCANVVRIIESLNIREMSTHNHLKLEDVHVTAIVPVKGDVQTLAGRPLIDYTLERARESSVLRDIVVATDTDRCADLARQAGALVVRRPPELSLDYVDLDDVLRFTVSELESRGTYPDLIVLLEITFPFRQPGFLDQIIRHLVENGLDSVLPAYREYRSCWRREGDRVSRIDQGFVPRKYKQPTFVGLRGLGFVTHPALVREGNPLGQKVGLLDVPDPRCAIEVRDEIGFHLGEKLIREWVAAHSDAAAL